MKNKQTPILISLVILICLFLTSCSTFENFQVNMGWKNKDFDYIKNNKVGKIVIQSTRDTGFRFVVTDHRTISELYSLLSSAKDVSKKSGLQADYIFELHIGKEIKKFNYVVGIYDKKIGNFYDESNIYSVSKRLDNDIIQNLSFIRKPREFENVYYPSILQTLKENKDTLLESGKVGIDLSGDVDCAKYIFSTDLEDFKRDLKEILPDAEIVNRNKEDFRVIVSVKNQGYKTKTFKTIVSIDNKDDKSQTNYYVNCTYDSDWQIEISTSKPNSW
ncbi:lipoprotein [Clostridium polyendosporum]|uniref:Lipoprotein n=1 Tax=Clostridium polyendosporum TaxID=69208 RepID=A0A919S0G3_9CLOT|nr:hypothetical protein [Clostridium polyendosporum]GIM29036.1 lipoprotein [Clostridium polyendosporum]